MEIPTLIYEHTCLMNETGGLLGFDCSSAILCFVPNAFIKLKQIKCSYAW